MSAGRLSMRASLALAIAAIGLVGLLLTFASGEFYRGLTLDTERANTTEFLRREAARLREDFELRARALATHAEAQATFRKALAHGAAPALVHELDELHRHANSGSFAGVRASRVYLLDAKFKHVAASSLGEPAPAQLPCANMLNGAMVASRNRPSHRLCLVDDKPHFLALVPLSGLIDGHLYVVGDLIAGINDVEQALTVPLRLRRADGAVMYQSPEWPVGEALAQHAVATLGLMVTGPRFGSLELAAARDISAVYQRLDHLRYVILLSVAMLAALSLLIVLAILERSTFRPLRALAEQLRRLRQDKQAAGEPVRVGGNKDLVALAEAFNDLTGRLRESHESLERMAFTDALTELPNRSLFQDRLQQVILAAKREGKPFALLFMDLDRFKDINDTLGHGVGDILLTQVSHRLRAKLRASDTVARMGGDEFAVLLPAVDAKHAGMAARMLLQALRAPFVVTDHDLNIGASIGIAMYPENGVEASVLMQRADVAMYSAKESGGGFAFYSPAIDQNLPTRLTRMHDLRQAVEQEEFELFYQPVVNLVTHRVAGLEALARWRHPRDGLLLPDTFIPLLEQSGMIRGLMPWVVSEALKRAHALEAAGSPLSVSVNLSMRDLQDPCIVDSIGELLQANEVDPSVLLLEITESAVMTDAPRTLELLNRLSAMGLRIAIDDFGTGYSSLTYLKRLPVTTLKIDKSFVTGMIEDENDAAIVRTSIDLAHNLGLKVVAEGVESEAALKHLKALGCDLAQGHFVGRPLSAPELDQWLLQSTWGFGELDPLVAPVLKQLHS
jgi:diguanylate cyclase (GGDEF)-like protein